MADRAIPVEGVVLLWDIDLARFYDARSRAKSNRGPGVEWGGCLPEKPPRLRESDSTIASARALACSLPTLRGLTFPTAERAIPVEGVVLFRALTSLGYLAPDCTHRASAAPRTEWQAPA